MLRLKAPKIGGERTVFIHQLAGPFAVVDGRFDFTTMPNDSCLQKEVLDFVLGESRDLFEIKVLER